MQNPLISNNHRKPDAFEILFELKMDETPAVNQNSMTIQTVTGKHDIEQLVLQSIHTAYTKDVRNLGIKIILQLDTELCLGAEERFCMYSSGLYEDDNPRNHTEIAIKQGLFEVIRHWYSEDIQRDENNQILCHLYLSQLTRRILSRSEFDTAFDSHPSMERHWKEQMWWHNTHCSILFVYTYQEILHSIKSIQEYAETPREVLQLANWMLTMVGLIEKFRRNFAFCVECEMNNEAECEFWKDTTVKINLFVANTPPQLNLLKVKTYFNEMEMRCKIPKTLTDLGSKQTPSSEEVAQVK